MSTETREFSTLAVCSFVTGRTFAPPGELSDLYNFITHGDDVAMTDSMVHVVTLMCPYLVDGILAQHPRLYGLRINHALHNARSIASLRRRLHHTYGMTMPISRQRR